MLVRHYWEWFDPLNGKEMATPMGDGTGDKRDIFLDSSFPFLHQSIVFVERKMYLCKKIRVVLKYS